MTPTSRIVDARAVPVFATLEDPAAEAAAG